MKTKSASLALTLALSLVPLQSQAQGHVIKLMNHLQPYGFFRTTAVFDSRDSKTDVDDLFYCLPYDKEINLEGNDIHYNPSFKMSSATTRLGFNLTGFQYGSFNVTGKVEADFTMLTDGTSALRLREAYSDFAWDGLGMLVNFASVRVGHAWHPMSVDMPYGLGYEAGSPFNPYARSPQIMAEVGFLKHFSLTLGALYPSENKPVGPSGTTDEYVRYGLIPELYAGLTYRGKHVVAKVGADFLSLVPRWRTTTTDDYSYDIGTKTTDRFYTINPMVYAEYSKGRFKVNAKGIFASGGDHLGLMGGYAVYKKNSAYDYEYTPLRSIVGFGSISYGDQWQFRVYGGAMAALGSRHRLQTDYSTGYAKTANIYYNSLGSMNINYIGRIAPSVVYNLENLSVGVEYNLTGVVYGDSDSMNSRGLAVNNKRLIFNHRVLAMVKYSF